MTTTTTDLQQRRFRRAQWRTLSALMFCYLFFYLGRHNYGWAFPYMQAELGLTYGQLGIFSMVLLLCYGIGQFVNGNFAEVLSDLTHGPADRHSRRRPACPDAVHRPRSFPECRSCLFRASPLPAV